MHPAGDGAGAIVPIGMLPWALTGEVTSSAAVAMPIKLWPSLASALGAVMVLYCAKGISQAVFTGV